jgi:heptose-I-phosphate ethanolaminephosphotransferase
MILLVAIILPACLFCKRELLSIRKSRNYNITVISILILCFIIEIPTTFRYVQLFLQKQNIEKIEGLIFRHYHEEIPTPLHRIAFAYYASTQSAHILNGIKHSTLTANIDTCSYSSQHIVLIIGESYNKHHSSLYGYHLPTAPLQQQRKNKGELFQFTNAVTPWNITSNVFLDMFSLWEQGCKNHITDYPLFPILFQRAGYSVTFFSNQYLIKGFRKGATNQAGHFFLADRELSDSLFSFRNLKSSKYDMGIVAQLESFLEKRQCSDYTLDIIHLIGQHFDYSVRYPSSQSPFSINDYKERKLKKNAKEIVMHYDNATRYNDTVLDSVLSLYENKEAIVLFIADHGEEIYDEIYTHGRLFQDPDVNQAINEFEVPMWIWCSKSYKNNHPDVISAIIASVEKPFLTDGVPYILMYLAGIRCNWADEKNNLLSPHYQNKTRIIGGSVDYDQLVK